MSRVQNMKSCCMWLFIANLMQGWVTATITEAAAVLDMHKSTTESCPQQGHTATSIQQAANPKAAQQAKRCHKSKGCITEFDR